MQIILLIRINDILIQVNTSVYSDNMVQVQLRMPEDVVQEVDQLVKEDKFKNRSDAIKGIVAIYMESRKTRKFFKMLNKLSKEAKEHPEKLIPIEDV